MSRTALYTMVATAIFLGLGQANNADAEISVQPGEPIQTVEAKYPKHAAKLRIEGVVALHVTIAADGKVKNVSVVNGNPELASAAMDAVRKWSFQPYVKDGNNVEGQRDVSITFRLNDSSNSGCAVDTEIVSVISPGITPPAAIHAKEPEYTENARQKRIQGNVVLSVVVGSNGHVCDARIERSLYPELDDRAIETVDKWLFRPAQKDGRPIAVRISVQVQFRLY